MYVGSCVIHIHMQHMRHRYVYTHTYELLLFRFWHCIITINCSGIESKHPSDEMHYQDFRTKSIVAEKMWSIYNWPHAHTTQYLLVHMYIYIYIYETPYIHVHNSDFITTMLCLHILPALDKHIEKQQCAIWKLEELLFGQQDIQPVNLSNTSLQLPGLHGLAIRKSSEGYGRWILWGVYKQHSRYQNARYKT